MERERVRFVLPSGDTVERETAHVPDPTDVFEYNDDEYAVYRVKRVFETSPSRTKASVVHEALLREEPDP